MSRLLGSSTIHPWKVKINDDLSCPVCKICDKYDENACAKRRKYMKTYQCSTDLKSIYPRFIFFYNQI